jgi:uncharacterized protein (DUF488 family)
VYKIEVITALVYTIGHSNHPIEEFIKLLNHYSINCVCDVRSTPYSRYAEQYNREYLKEVLESKNIMYLYFGDEFGARRNEKSLLTDGVVDFIKVAKDDKFICGITRVKKGIQKDYRIVLMCTEKEPLECHRTILVSKNLEASGISVAHILANGFVKSHKIIEEELVKKYFPDANQTSLFDTRELMDNLAESYRRANLEIGYRKE